MLIGLPSNLHPKWHNTCMRPGSQLNIKMSSYPYRKSHCGDKTVVRSSYLHNGVSYTGKNISLYLIRAQYHLNQATAKAKPLIPK